MAPIAKMYTLGHTFMPPPVHAGGLRYHGMAPIICHLHKLGFIEARAVPQLATFEAGVTFARTEGIISAPETNHAIRVTIDEALKCKESGEVQDHPARPQRTRALRHGRLRGLSLRQAPGL